MIYCEKKIFWVTDQFALNFFISIMISQTIFDKSGFLCVSFAVSGVRICLASAALLCLLFLYWITGCMVWPLLKPLAKAMHWFVSN